jgi:mono/diheme cytochrome c family protein
VRICWLSVACTLVACAGDPTPLERGRVVYLTSCAPCHGERGDGVGPSAVGMRPPPRDFTAPRFRIKFGSVTGGKLPTDDDLRRVIRHGLPGTAMPAWDLAPADLEAVILYLKTLSPRWAKEAPGEAVAIPDDPWGGRETEAVREGSRLYHTVARCASCHPSYATPDELTAWTGAPEIRPDDRTSVGRRDSDYKLAGKKLATVPPDFTLQPMRGVRDRRDLYRTIAAGIGGTAMPAFALPDDPTGAQTWAIVHYVDALRRGASW